MPNTQDVVVITGASAGHGRAVARSFAREGAKIGLLARGREGLEAAGREVESLGGQAFIVPTDVSDPEQVEAAAQAVEAEFGPITVWVNNAMVSVFSPVKKLRPEEVARVTGVTYLGYVYGTMAALRRMLPRDRGVIIQVGSALAYRGIPLQAAYCGAKHAIQGFTESLRTELLHDKSRVRVTLVQMPAMNTTQFTWSKNNMAHNPQPVPPIYEPEVAARAVVWAARHDRREIDVGASTVAAIIANKLAPGILDHYLARQGYSAQQAPELADPERPNNLWEPVPGDHGVHGPFSARSTRHSPQVWTTLHRGTIAAITGLTLAALAAGLWGGRRAARALPAPSRPLASADGLRLRELPAA
ncbi:MAG: SDR family oxidoreductase [Acidiferrobacter sp.]